MFGLIKRKRGRSNYGRFLKMIDDLQTPKHKTNHNYRSYSPPMKIIFFAQLVQTG